jgi:hypothetical protein
MAWRVARSLEVLLAQFNAACPGRSKASDGSIGDADHAKRDSDHNPWYGPGVVTARDFTHDPAHGMDISVIADQLAASRDKRIKYIIANALILDTRPNCRPWKWVPYTGSNPHRKHLHLSVMNNASCDDPTPWDLPMFRHLPTPPPSQGAAGRVLKVTVPYMSGDDVRALQRVLNSWYPADPRLDTDGRYGPATEAAVRRFQARAGLRADGVAGPTTLAALRLI